MAGGTRAGAKGAAAPATVPVGSIADEARLGVNELRFLHSARTEAMVKLAGAGGDDSLPYSNIRHGGAILTFREYLDELDRYEEGVRDYIRPAALKLAEKRFAAEQATQDAAAMEELAELELEDADGK